MHPHLFIVSGRRAAHHQKVRKGAPRHHGSDRRKTLNLRGLTSPRELMGAPVSSRGFPVSSRGCELTEAGIYTVYFMFATGCTLLSLKWRGEGEVPTLRIRPCRGPFPRAQQRCRIIREAATGEYSLLPGLEAPQDGWLKSRRQQNHNDCNIALQVRAGPSPSPVLPKWPVLAAQVTRHAVVTWDCPPTCAEDAGYEKVQQTHMTG